MIRVFFRYEDERLNGEQFGELKTDPIKAPYGQVPLLCFNGTVICQSMTIARQAMDSRFNRLIEKSNQGSLWTITEDPTIASLWCFNGTVICQSKNIIGH